MGSRAGSAALLINKLLASALSAGSYALRHGRTDQAGGVALCVPKAVVVMLAHQGSPVADCSPATRSMAVLRTALDVTSEAPACMMSLPISAAESVAGELPDPVASAADA